MSRALEYLTKLQNQRVLVLGGTSGIGFCVAEAALAHGAHVIVSSSNSDKLSKTLERLNPVVCPLPAPSGSVKAIPCDLADATNIEANLTRMLDAATENGTQLLDHVVFTAGDALLRTKLADAQPDTWAKACLVRVTGPIMLAKLLPRYQKQDPASSLTLSGGSTNHRPPPGFSIPGAFSAAIEGLTRGFAVDLKPVRVNAVAPGAVHTELLDGFGAELLETFKNASLTGTVGRPEDLAEVYLQCMKNHFVDGAILLIDGGKNLA